MRSQACAAQALGHPDGRLRRRVDAADDPPGKTRTARWLDKLNRLRVVNRRLDWTDTGVLERRTGQSRNIARNAKHAEAVATIRRQVQIDDGIGQRQVARSAAEPTGASAGKCHDAV